MADNTPDPKKLKESKQEAEEITSTFRDYRDILKEVNVEIGKKNNSLKEAQKSYTKLESIASQLANDEENLVSLSQDQIDKLREQSTIQLKSIKDAADRLAKEKDILEIDDDIFKKKLEELKATNQLDEKEESLLKARKEQFTIEENFLKNVEKRLKQEENINKAMGLGGAALKGANEAMAKFGLGQVASLMNFDKANEAMKKQAKLVTDNGNKAAGFAGKFKVLSAGLSELGKGLAKNLTDPLVIIGGMINGFLKLNKAQTEYGRLTGSNINSLDTLNGKLITGVDYIQAATDLTKQFGFAADAVFTKEDIEEVAEMTTQIGLAAEEAGALAALSKINGKEIKDQNDSLIKEVNQFQKVNGVALNKKQILQDVAKSSLAFQVSMGGNEKKIAAAAMEARKLGLTLVEIEKTADSLLNFEQSIANELEAELLTGKELNLDRARGLALNNDMEGVAKEIGKNQAIISTFAHGNRIQQDAIAKSLGLSRDEVAKMIVADKMRRNVNREALNDNEKALYDDMKRVEVQKQFEIVISKVQQALFPIVEGFAKLLDNSYVLIPLLTVIGTIIAVKIAKSISNTVKDMKSLGKGFASMFKSSKDAIPKTDSISKAAQSTKGVKGSQGKETKNFLKGLGDGLASMGGPNFMKVVTGALALGVASIILGGSFALAMMMLKNVDPVQMIAFSASLGILGATVALMGKYASGIIQGALAMGILAVALIPAAFAFSLLKGVDISSIVAFSIALPLLALAAAGLGFLFPFIALGSAALAILGLALMPAAIAFNMLKGIDFKVVESFSTMLLGLATDVAEMGGMFISITLGAVSLGILGLALMAFAVGAAVAARIAPDISLLKDSIKALADPEMLTGIKETGPALVALGVGAAAFGIGLIGLGYGLALFTVGAAMASMVADKLEPLFDQLIKLADPVLAAGLMLTASALIPLSIGLTAVGAAIAAGGMGSLIGSVLGIGSGGGIISQLERLARIGNPLKLAAVSINELAVGLKQVANALRDLDVEKIEALEDFVITEALASAGKNIVAAFTAPLQAIGNLLGGGGESDEDVMREIRDLLREIKNKEGVVTLDGNKVGTALGMGRYKTQ